jgi:excisionase family DNA binding protein
LTITVSEAARRSGLSRKTILRMIKAGRAAETEQENAA